MSIVLHCHSSDPCISVLTCAQSACEVGGRNVGHDWHWRAEDAETAPSRFGMHVGTGPAQNCAGRLSLHRRGDGKRPKRLTQSRPQSSSHPPFIFLPFSSFSRPLPPHHVLPTPAPVCARLPRPFPGIAISGRCAGDPNTQHSSGQVGAYDPPHTCEAVVK